MLVTVLMPKSFKTNISDSEYIERVVEVKKKKITIFLNFLPISYRAELEIYGT